MKQAFAHAIAVLGLFGSVSASAVAISVDGDLADWGVAVGSTSLVPTANVGIQATINDQIGSGSFFLDPGWGGQAYDAEAIYAMKSGNTLFIALLTGHNPRTLQQPNNNSYGAGDFAIDFGRNGSFDLGINIKHAVSGNASSGYTFESFGLEGEVYMNPTWAYGLWDVAGKYTDPNGSSYTPDPKHPTHLLGGTLVGALSQLSYHTTPVTGYGANQSDQHYVYEMSIDMGLLRQAGWNGSDAFDIHWTQNCANDSILVDPPGGSVPEPGTLALLGLGIVGLLLGRQRKKAAS